MSTTNGDGNQGTIGDRVAAQLFELVVELSESRRLQMVQETRITGLARVIKSGKVPFGPEQAHEVANVIQEAGDIDGLRMAKNHAKADKIRAVAGKR